MCERDLHQIAEDFFKSPNGTFLFEPFKAMAAIKVPLGGDERISVVMADRLWGRNDAKGGFFPDHNFKMETDSYVDNETGNRIKCRYGSSFSSVFDYDEGVQIHDAMREVAHAVADKLSSMAVDELAVYASLHGDDPMRALTLSEIDMERIRNDCHAAFVQGLDPEPYEAPEISLESMGEGQFALAYLKDKQALIIDKTSEIAPKLAAKFLFVHAMNAYAENHMRSLENNPDPATAKERAIREAIQDKSSVWATFGKGEETLRISIPTNSFRYGAADLNLYCMTNKESNRLEDFLDKKWPHRANISDIVALDYKGKTLYQDEAFYNMHRSQGQAPTSFNSLVNDAQTRASQHSGQSLGKETERCM